MLPRIRRRRIIIALFSPFGGSLFGFLFLWRLATFPCLLGFEFQRNGSFSSSRRPPLLYASNNNNKAATVGGGLFDDGNHHNGPPSLPTAAISITNPTTKRKIRVGGPVYKDFMSQGTWVQHSGTLKRLNLKALRRHQQQQKQRGGEEEEEELTHDNGPSGNGVAVVAEKQEEKDLEEMLLHEIYGITPSILDTDTTLAVAADEKDKAGNDLLLLGNQLLFVNKPAGLHCVSPRNPSFGSKSLSCQIVSWNNDHTKPCHRLDRDTSGIVLFGLTREAHRDISKQFEERTTQKTYMALVSGHFEKDHGIINMAIGKQKTKEGFNRWVIGGDKPREAITEWHVDKLFTDADTGAKWTRMKLKPKTGRGHQLRLHMKACGHPILGDTIHGKDDGSGGVATCSPRLCLHAHKLQVVWNGLRLEATSVTPF